jgi:hypothetical protein
VIDRAAVAWASEPPAACPLGDAGGRHSADAEHRRGYRGLRRSVRRFIGRPVHLAPEPRAMSQCTWMLAMRDVIAYYLPEAPHAVDDAEIVLSFLNDEQRRDLRACLHRRRRARGELMGSARRYLVSGCWLRIGRRSIDYRGGSRRPEGLSRRASGRQLETCSVSTSQNCPGHRLPKGRSRWTAARGDRAGGPRPSPALRTLLPSSGRVVVRRVGRKRRSVLELLSFRPAESAQSSPGVDTTMDGLSRPRKVKTASTDLLRAMVKLFCERLLAEEGAICSTPTASDRTSE